MNLSAVRKEFFVNGEKITVGKSVGCIAFFGIGTAEIQINQLCGFRRNIAVEILRTAP
jgi:hypothetical protein